MLEHWVELEFALLEGLHDIRGSTSCAPLGRPTGRPALFVRTAPARGVPALRQGGGKRPGGKAMV